MRSSKSRSRSKQNRQRSPMGNIVNRVFDSSGPEGKVRGTPQQIIDKYLTLARDAQLGNDRVAAENFQQHAEHYARMLGEAQRELEAQRQQYGGGEPRGQDDRDEGRRDDRDERRDEGRREDRRDEGRREDRRDDRRDDRREGRRDGPREPAASPAVAEVIEVGAEEGDDGPGLVETPEMQAAPAEAEPAAPREEERGEGRGGRGRRGRRPRGERPDGATEPPSEAAE
jgi:hypothetical protein